LLQPSIRNSGDYLIRRFNKLLDYILHLTTAVTAMLFFLIVLASVVVRAVPAIGFNSAMELSRLLFVWSCFLAAALTYRRQACGVNILLT
jgi:TRAP-type C4-dicarboxylate transport system permease small subunit